MVPKRTKLTQLLQSYEAKLFLCELENFQTFRFRNFFLIDFKIFDPCSKILYSSGSMQKTRSKTFQLKKFTKNNAI